MTGKEAAKEMIKIVAKEYCSIKQELTKYKDGRIEIEYKIYTEKKGWFFGENWEAVIKQLKEKYKEVESAN